MLKDTIAKIRQPIGWMTTPAPVLIEGEHILLRTAAQCVRQRFSWWRNPGPVSFGMLTLTNLRLVYASVRRNPATLFLMRYPAELRSVDVSTADISRIRTGWWLRKTWWGPIGTPGLTMMDVHLHDGTRLSFAGLGRRRLRSALAELKRLYPSLDA